MQKYDKNKNPSSAICDFVYAALGFLQVFYERIYSTIHNCVILRDKNAERKYWQTESDKEKEWRRVASVNCLPLIIFCTADGYFLERSLVNKLLKMRGYSQTFTFMQYRETLPCCCLRLRHCLRFSGRMAKADFRMVVAACEQTCGRIQSLIEGGNICGENKI